VIRSGVVHVGSRSERELIEGFVHSLAEVPSPCLVGFNSSSFDLPVLRYRAFALAVPAQVIHGSNGRDYWYRYSSLRTNFLCGFQICKPCRSIT
jgi:predicted PolB exonuclease-like 3'-5' exonuclease